VPLWLGPRECSTYPEIPESRERDFQKAKGSGDPDPFNLSEGPAHESTVVWLDERGHF